MAYIAKRGQRGSLPVNGLPSPRLKGLNEKPVKPGDILVLIGCGPMGTGMEETYQLTSALKYLPGWKNHCPDHRRAFQRREHGRMHRSCRSGSAGRRFPREAAGRRHVQIIVDPIRLSGRIDFIGDGARRFDPAEGAHILDSRPPHPNLRPDPDLPEDTRLWAALQNISGGTWGGCVYDVDEIVEKSGRLTMLLTKHRFENGIRWAVDGRFLPSNLNLSMLLGLSREKMQNLLEEASGGLTSIRGRRSANRSKPGSMGCGCHIFTEPGCAQSRIHRGGHVPESL